MIRDNLGHQRHKYGRSAPTPPDPHSQTMPKNWRFFPRDVKQPSLSCLKVVLSQCLSSHVLSAATTLTFSCCYPFSRTHRRSLSQSTASPFCLTRCMASLASFFKASLTIKILAPPPCPLLKLTSTFLLQPSWSPPHLAKLRGKWLLVSSSKTVFSHCPESVKHQELLMHQDYDTNNCHCFLIVCVTAPVVPYI